jgi:hypothetical protein
MKKITAVIRVAGTLLLISSFELACVVHERSYAESAPPPSPAPAAPTPPPPAPAAPTPAPPPAPHPEPAAPPAAHPWYLHALSDLRNARANLERKGGDGKMKWDEHEAIDAIDRAIRDIKTASIDDGKNIDDHPPIDVHEPRSGRLHRALAALHTAREDVSKEEDNAYANGLRNRAIHDIEEAVHLTEAGVAEAARTS